MSTAEGKAPYSLEVNKALLKNYQANNDIINVDAVTNILALSLMRLPSSDYLAISYLVPRSAKITGSAAVRSLTKLADHLERAQFVEAWAEIAASGAAFGSVKGFEAAVKSFETSLKESL